MSAMCSGTASATDSQMTEKCDFKIMVSFVKKSQGYVLHVPKDTASLEYTESACHMTGVVQFNALLFLLFVPVAWPVCGEAEKVFDVVLLVTGLRMLVQSFL